MRRSLLGAIMVIGLAACNGGIEPEFELATKDREPSFSIHMVDEASDNSQAMRIAYERGMVPPGTVFLPYPSQNRSLIVVERTQINQDCITSANSGQHPEREEPILNFQLDDNCSIVFAKLTSENIGKRFAMVVDGEILTAPKIRTAITSGSGFIEGAFTEKEVRELAFMLNRNARRKR